MKRTNNLIPTLIALTAACAAAQPVQAQAPARQAFPWSSASAAQTASPAATAVQNYSRASAETYSSPVSQSIGNATSIASNALSVGEAIYFDESGNKITREQMQAKLSSSTNNVSSALGSTLGSASGVVQSFGQNLGHKFQQRVTPLQSEDNSAWGKAKSLTSKATSFWKKPSLFKAPEGITLPSMKTTWAKPKFQEPTTWFSRKAADPITFAPIDSLPRKGKIPTAIDGPLTSSPAQFASQSPAPVQYPSYQANNFQSSAEPTAQSIFSSADYEVAENLENNDFDPRR